MTMGPGSTYRTALDNHLPAKWHCRVIRDKIWINDVVLDHFFLLIESV